MGLLGWIETTLKPRLQKKEQNQNQEQRVKVNKSKLQTHRRKFEQLTMKEEDIAGYLQRVDEVVNIMRGLGEEIDESKVVEKILRSLPAKYDSKVSAIEDIKDLDSLSKDKLHGILAAYEMKTESDNPTKGEAAFKTSKKAHKHRTSSVCSSEDDEEAHFSKRLQ